jgi:hypothetical protein
VIDKAILGLTLGINKFARDRPFMVRSQRLALFLVIKLDHWFAAVCGIADQLLAARVDDEVEQLQRHRADKNRTVVGQFGDVRYALSPDSIAGRPRF